MRAPNRIDHERIISLLGDADAIYEAVEEYNLPDEVASRWYSYLVDADDGLTVEEAIHLFNKSWV